MQKFLRTLTLMALLVVPWVTQAQQTLPYSYGFEDNDLTTDGWLLLNSSSSYTGINGSAAQNGSYGFQFNYSESNDATLISPVLTGTTNGVTVSFSYKESSDSYGDEQFYVGYTTDETVTSPSDFTYGSIITASLSWQQYENTFPAGTKRIAIKYVYNDALYLFLDDFTFEVPSSCVKPSAINITGATTSSISISWTPAGSETSWNVYLNGVQVNTTPVTTTSYTFNGLTENNDYTLGVSAICGSSESALKTTLVHLGYCVPAPTSVDGSGISNVTFGSSLIVNDNLSMTSSPYYYDHSSQIGDVFPGGTVNMSINYVTNYSYYTWVWVDWNNDFTFSESEKVYAATSSISSGILNLSFDVPSNTPLGDYRMRIMGKDGTTNNPCYTGTYAYLVDYTLRVSTPPSCMPVTALTGTPSGTTVTLTWTDENNTGATYIVKEGENVLSSNATSPYVINNVTLGDHTYSVMVDCGSSTANPVSTNVHVGYCVPSPSNVDGTGITSVSFGGMTNTTHLGSTAGYADYSSMAGSVPASTTASVEIAYGHQYTYGTIIWVDWNNDMTFSGDEVVFAGQSPGGSASTNYFTATFDIPATQAVGNYRMRILGADSYFDTYTGSLSAAADANPCATGYSWGVAEDYTLTVTPAPTCYKPTAFTYSDVTPNGATLTWTRDTRNADGETYSILDENNQVVTGAGNISGTTYQLTGLTQNTEYTFKVRTNCADPSENVDDLTVTFTTLADCAAPVLAANGITNVTAHTADIEWTGFASNNSYVVSYRSPEYLDGVAEEFAASSAPTGWSMYTGLLSNIMSGTALTSATSGWSFGSNNGVFNSHARCNIYSNYQRWLVTPEIAVPNNASLNFDLALTAYSGTVASPSTTGTDDKFVVLVSTDNMSTWSILRQWDNAGSAYVYNNITCSATGENVNIDLSAYAGQNVKIAFYGESTTSNADNNLHIDNVAIGTVIPATAWQTVSANTTSTTLTGLADETPYEVKVTGICAGNVESDESAVQTFTTLPSCMAITGLTVPDVTTNSVTLSWTDNGNVGATYTIYNVTDNNSIVASGVNATTYTVTGLTENTAYTFGVLPICQEGETTKTTVSTRTACAAKSLPLTWTFEADELMTTSNSVATPALPWCSYRYVTPSASSGTTYPYSYSSSTYAHNSTRSLYFYGTTSATYPLQMAWIMPEVDVTNFPMNGNRVTFYARSSSTSYNKVVHVGTMTDPTDWSTYTEVGTVTVTGTTHTLYKRSLTAANATDAYVVLMVERGSGSLYIDDVTLEELPACVEITNLAVADATDNTLTLTWTDADNEDVTYTIYNMDDNSIVGTGVTTTTYTVNGLTANTPYTFGVQANCLTGDATISTVNARTACLAITPLPYAEDFSGYTDFTTYPYYGPSKTPYCWDYYSNGTNTASSTSTSNYYGGVASYNGTSYGSMVSNNPYLYMPIQLTGANVTSSTYINYGTQRGSVKIAAMPLFDQPLNNIQVSFNYKMSSTYSATGAAAVLELGYITNDDFTTFEPMQSWNAVTTTQSVKLSLNELAALAPANARLAFKFSGVHNGTGTSSYTNVACGIDNITVQQIPTVLNVEASNVTATSVDLNWDVFRTCNGVSYTVTYGSESAIVSGTSTTIQNLTPNTNYTFTVSSSCAAANEDVPSVAVTTLQIPAAVPYATGFEATDDNNMWTLVNDATNAWYFGTAANNGGEQGLYISNDGGVSNAYTVSGIQWSYAYRMLDFSEAGWYKFNFDWHAYGESSYDFIRAWLAPSAVSLSPAASPTGTTSASGYTSTTPTGWIDLNPNNGKLNLQSSWQSLENIKEIAAPGTYTLVLMWANDVSGGTMPPAAVDNISIMRNAFEPINLTATNITSTGATLTWERDTLNGQTAGVNDETYNVVLNGNVVNAEPINGTSYDVTLTVNTDYTFGVYAVNHTDTSDVEYVSMLVNEYPTVAGRMVSLDYSYNWTGTNEPSVSLYYGIGATRAAVAAESYTETSLDSVFTNTSSNDWPAYGPVTAVFLNHNANPIGFTTASVSYNCPTYILDREPVTPEAQNGDYTWTTPEGIVYNYSNHVVAAAAADMSFSTDDTVLNIGGCDSIYNHLVLQTLHPSYTIAVDTAICERDVFTVGAGRPDAVDFTTTGNYVVTLTSQYGADSVINLALQVNAAPIAYIYYNNRNVTTVDNFCEGFNMNLEARSNVNAATYEWEDASNAANRVVNPSGSNTYTVVATDPSYGCTSVPVSLTVTTTPIPVLTVTGNEAICIGNSATLTVTDANAISGVTYRWYNAATNTVVGTGATLTVTPTETTVYNVVAEGECPVTSENFTVTVNPLPVVEVATSANVLCYGAPLTISATEGFAAYEWNIGSNGATTTIAATSTGAYTVTVTDVNGCVSEKTTSVVTVNPVYELNDTMSVCYLQNPYTWGAQTLTADGDYDQTFQTVNSCDSLVHMTFSFQQMGVENSYREVCQNTDVTWGSTTYPSVQESATLTYVLNAGDVDPNNVVLECPVTYNLFLTVNPVKASSFEQVACDSYTWNVSNETYNVSGAYPYTLQTTKGCDSVVTMNLTVNYQNTGVDTQVACDTYEWIDGNIYTASNNTATYRLANANALGCDSTVTLNLTVNYKNYEVYQHRECNSRSYTWLDGNTYDLSVDSTAGITYTYTGFTNAAGCDSIAILHLVMNPVIDTMKWVNITVCDEYLIDTVACDGSVAQMSIHNSGDYEIRTHNTTTNRDQWTRIHLTVNTSEYHTSIVEECVPYTWTVNNYVIGTYDPVANDTVVTYAMDGQYTTNGCNNIEVLRLKAKRATTGAFTAAVCDAGTASTYNWYDGATFVGSYSAADAGTIEHVFAGANAAGCDSTVTLTLTVNQHSTAIDQAVACESYTWNLNGTTYTASTNEPSVTLAGADVNGCDSIVTLNLTVNYNNTGIDNQVACESYKWMDDSTYTASTTEPTFVLTNADGCDSTVTLNLTVNYSTTGDEAVMGCYTYNYIYDGDTLDTYTENGTYTVTLANANAAQCDSVVTLQVTILDTVRAYQTIDACVEYTYMGTTYTESKTFREVSGQSVNGCDSVTYITYNVLQRELVDQYVVTNIPYTWQNGVTYTQNVSSSDAVYFDVTGTRACDSVIRLNLTWIEDTTVVCESQAPYNIGLGINIDYIYNQVYPFDMNDINGYTTLGWGSGYDTVGAFVWRTTFGAGEHINATQLFGANVYASRLPDDGLYQMEVAVNGNIVATNSYTISELGFHKLLLDTPVTIADNDEVIITLSANGEYPAFSAILNNGINNCEYYDPDDDTWYSPAPYAWYVAGLFNNEDGLGNGYTYTQGDGIHDTILYFQVFRNANVEVPVDACESYTWMANNQTYTENGNYLYTKEGAHFGCDSTYLLILTVNHNTNTAYTAEACDTYTWNNNGNTVTKTESGTYYSEYNTTDGCASVDTLYLTIKNSTDSVLTTAACDTYTWNGETFTISIDTVIDNLTNAAGCDSTATLHLTINNSVVVNLDSIVNAASTYFDSALYIAPYEGVFVHNGTTIHGCDSTTNITLKVNAGKIGNDTVDACGYFTWRDGNTYIWTGNPVNPVFGYVNATNNNAPVLENPTFSTYNADGTIDSLYVLWLTLMEANYADSTISRFPLSQGTLTVGNDTLGYQVLDFTGYTANATVTREVRFNSTYYCSNIINYTVNLVWDYDTLAPVSVCYATDNYELNGNDHALAVGENIITEVFNAGTADEQVTTVYVTRYADPTTSVNVTDFICDEYNWNDNNGFDMTITTSGSYTHTFTDVNGCDSVVTLTLTVNHNSNSSTSAVACDTYNWIDAVINVDTIITTSGNYTHSYTAANGCPSVDTLYLTVNYNSNTVFTPDVCDSYTWVATDNTTVGTFNSNTVQEYIYMNPDNNCPSVDSLFLTIRTSTNGTDVKVVCDSLRWIDNILYTADNSTATYTLTNAIGCDSVVTLNLTINTNPGTSETVTECDSYTWQYMTEPLTASNTYSVNYTDANGCVGAHVLNLTINTNEGTSETVTECDSYTWQYMTEPLTVSNTYSVNYTDANGCVGAHELNLTINNSVVVDSIINEIGSSYRFNNVLYLAPIVDSVVPIHYTNLAGCDSLVNFHLTVTPFAYTYDNQIACGLYTWSLNGHTYQYISNEVSAANGNAYYYDMTAGAYVTAEPRDTAANGIDVTILNLTLNEAVFANETIDFPLSNGTLVKPDKVYDFTSYRDSHTEATVYDTVSLGSNYYCDSIVFRTINLIDNYDTLANVYVCNSVTSYNFNNVDYTLAVGDNMLTETFNAGTADVRVKTVTVVRLADMADDTNAVACDSFDWYEHANLTTSGNYQHTFSVTKFGVACDSVLTLHLTVNNSNSQALTDAICLGNGYTANGFTIAAAELAVAGEYTFTNDNLTNAANCDSVATLTLTVNPLLETNLTDAVCFGNDYSGYGFNIAAADLTVGDTNLVLNTTTVVTGCDSTVNMVLTVNPVFTTALVDAVCLGEGYTANGFNIDAADLATTGVYPFSTTTNTVLTGCDSVLNLTLTVNGQTTYDSVIYSSTGSYRFNGTLLGVGDYVDYAQSSSGLLNSVGCDSIYNYSIHVGTPYYATDSVNSCHTYTWRDGNTYRWLSDEERAANNNAIYFNETTNEYVLYRPTFRVEQTHDYDSVYTLLLNLMENYFGTDFDTVNVSEQSFAYGDSIFTFTAENDSAYGVLGYNGSTIVRDVHFAAGYYCDSVITLTLTVVNNYEEAAIDNICATQTNYTWRGQTISTATTDYDAMHVYRIYDTLANGTIEYITVNQHPFRYVTDRRTACDSYEWNGNTFTESTSNATVTLADQFGCDSVVTLVLTVRHSSDSVLTMTACDKFTWSGVEYTENTDTTISGLTNAAGCDSTAALHLTINYSSTEEITVADACDSYTWTYGGNVVDTYTMSCDTHYVTTNEYNCAHDVTLHLTVNASTHNAFDTTVCDTYKWHNINFTTSGDITYTYVNEAGCASADTLHLTINQHEVVSDFVAGVCDSYDWNGHIYTESGEKHVSYVDANGCAGDSVLTLTLGYTTNNAYTEAACHNYTWHGTTYTTTNDYTYPYVNDDGCPSVDTLHLTIGSMRVFEEQFATSCGAYTWTVNDSIIGIYDASVNTSVVLPNSLTGCDSVVYLRLTVNSIPETFETETICESQLANYTWNGYTFSGSSDTAYTATAANGCDSIAHMTLTVNPTLTTAISDVVCLGVNYNENGFDISADELLTPGEYTFTLNTTSAVTGCDSIVTLTLTVGEIITNSTTQVACDSYSWDAGDGQTYNYTTSGVYFTDSYNNAQGCKVVDTLHLTINVNSSSAETHAACDSYVWNGIERTETGTYTFAYTDANNCPSVDTLYLTIANNVTNTYTATACDSYDWHGARTESGVYVYNYTTSGNCSGSDTLVLTINNSNASVDVLTACESYTWIDGIEYTASNNTATYTLTNAAGCDSVVTLNLTVNNGIFTSESAVACDSYAWNGSVYTVSGDYTYAYTDANGCANADTLHLTVNYNTNNGENVTICDNYTWNGTTYTQSGTYYRHYNTADGCASVDTLFLTVNNNANTSLTATACDSYTWNNDIYNQSGIYSQTFNAANGCDSVVTLTLTVNYNTNNGESMTACDSYTWNGTAYNASGDYTYAYTANNGCASVDTLHLTINNSATGTMVASTCGSYEWNGITYSTGGVYTQTMTAANGCDSVVTLTLTLNPATTTNISESVCGSYTWAGTTYTASGIYTNTYTAASGCDSVVNLYLTILAPISITNTVTACDSYTWNNTAYTTSGNYTNTFTAANGCDSVVTLNLTINNSVNAVITATACDSYTWNGATYTTSGAYTQNFSTVNGCDSIVTLNLTISPAITNTLNVSECGSYTWNGTTYTTSGNYTTTFTSSNGCDSTVTLMLTINQPKTTNMVATACDSYTWNGTAYTTSGNYSVTYTGANGCDSVVTLALTVNNSVNTVLSATACESYTWNGATYTTSGAYSLQRVTTAGCDSTVTLNLTILPTVTSTISQEVCNSYTWNNQTYTASGAYTQTFNAANGCDSVVTLNLTITQPVQMVVNVTACDSYTWNGQTYTTSGNYSATYTAANGCDSIVTLNLTINNAVATAETVTACDSYTWDGQTYSTSGVYTRSYVSSTGCDSTVTLTLFVINAIATSDVATACDSYTWNNTTYDTTGTYTQVFTSAAGCDSVVTLYLTVNHSEATTDVQFGCDSFTWIDGETYTASTNTPVVTLTTAAGCDSVVTLNLTMGYTVYSVQVEEACDGFIWVNGTNYTESTTEPVYTFHPANGCDSVVNLHLTINNSVETFDTVTVLQSNLPYDYSGTQITAAGDYEFNYSTVHGCDSTVYLHVNITGDVQGIDVVSNLDDVTVYPNPTHGRLTVTAENVVKVEVLDIVGRRVALFENTNTFDISNLGEGAYTLRITLPEGITVRRVVKK